MYFQFAGNDCSRSPKDCGSVTKFPAPRVPSGLTLNLGSRYDFFTPYSEIKGRIATWDNENDAYLMGNNANGGTSPAIKNNVGNAAGIKTDDHGVQPRISFAWNPVITWSCAVDMR